MDHTHLKTTTTTKFWPYTIQQNKRMLLKSVYIFKFLEFVNDPRSHVVPSDSDCSQPIFSLALNINYYITMNNTIANLIPYKKRTAEK